MSGPGPAPLAPTSLAIVVLAGGEGRRMGGEKSLRLLHGRSLVHRMAEAAFSLSRVVAISVREPAQAGDLDLPLILDDPDLAGPLAGLAAALDFAAAQACARLLTLPCDLASVPPDLLARLEAEAAAPAVLAASGGRLHPTVALWRVDATSEALPAYLVTGRRSLLGLAETAGYTTVEWPETEFANLNTPEDLAAAEAQPAPSPPSRHP